LALSDFLFNASEVTDLIDGTVTTYQYGDINTDGTIMGFDASLVLIYASGGSTEPFVSMPWEDWRIAISDVDGDGSVTSMDGSYIMQYAVGIITEFPAESMKKSSIAAPEIEIVQEGNHLVFYANGPLYGFDLLSVKGIGFEKLGKPERMVDSWLIATNIKEGTYKAGLATAIAEEGRHAFMRVPAQLNTEEITFNMLLNAHAKSTTFKAGVTAVEELEGISGFRLFPNPVSDKLKMEFALKNAAKVSLKILDNKGSLITQLENTKLANGEHHYQWDCSEMPAGIYHVEFINGDQKTVQKVIVTK
jgi:hypothetical protein